MNLNLDEMIKAIVGARAILASLSKDGNENTKAKEYKHRAANLLRDLGQTEEQLEMLRDMFYPTLPDSNGEDV